MKNHSKRCIIQSKRVEDHSTKSCPSYGYSTSAFSLFYIKRAHKGCWQNININNKHQQQTTIVLSHWPPINIWVLNFKHFEASLWSNLPDWTHCSDKHMASSYPLLPLVLILSNKRTTEKQERLMSSFIRAD